MITTIIKRITIEEHELEVTLQIDSSIHNINTPLGQMQDIEEEYEIEEVMLITEHESISILSLLDKLTTSKMIEEVCKHI